MTRFGRQRTPRDFFVILLLLAGFSGLAYAFLYFTSNWLGMLLPVAYLTGLWAAMRTEVRELELGDEALVVRTFFSSYRMPRAHIVRVVPTLLGPAVDVLNGNRYTIGPVGSDPAAVLLALEQWLRDGAGAPAGA